ncbi:MAG TPA: hypothetical protein DCL32_05580 [Gammaproteobacteria bacterium]|nr:hypothetical protein [Gammaproteobacteria bacterium]
MVADKTNVTFAAGSRLCRRRAERQLCLRWVNSCTVRLKSAIRHFHLGHSTNSIASNYGSGYALDVMRGHMERVW